MVVQHIVIEDVRPGFGGWADFWMEPPTLSLETREHYPEFCYKIKLGIWYYLWSPLPLSNNSSSTSWRWFVKLFEKFWIFSVYEIWCCFLMVARLFAKQGGYFDSSIIHRFILQKYFKTDCGWTERNSLKNNLMCV